MTGRLARMHGGQLAVLWLGAIGFGAIVWAAADGLAHMAEFDWNLWSGPESQSAATFAAQLDSIAHRISMDSARVLSAAERAANADHAHTLFLVWSIAHYVIPCLLALVMLVLSWRWFAMNHYSLLAGD